MGEGNGTPLQYSCVENPMDGGKSIESDMISQCQQVHSATAVPHQWVTCPTRSALPRNESEPGAGIEKGTK